ncbi:MAG: mechanosensitive ion channel family protein [Desulfosudaceae bacterium]
MITFTTKTIERLLSLNDTAQWILALVVLVTGIMVMEVLLSYIRGWIRATRTKQARPEIWRLNLIRVPIRLVVVALLIRFARLPLNLPEQFTITARDMENILMALAALVLIAYGLSVLSRMINALPEGLRQPFPDSDYNRIKRLILLTALIGLAGLVAMPRQTFLSPGGDAFFWWQYGLTVLAMLTLFFITRLISRFNTAITLAHHQSAESERLRLLLRAFLWPLRLLLLGATIYLVSKILPLPFRAAGDISAVLTLVLTIMALFLCAYLLIDLLRYRLKQFVKKEDNLFDDNFVHIIYLLSRVTVIIIGAIVMIQAVSGKPLSALLAGLGIGGLALALASQDTLKNLFAGFMIMMDKPFGLGERVVVDGKDGVVEQIGFRSTRLRTLTGHLVTVPNEKIASTNVENIAKRPHIRRLTNLTITYDTPPDKIERALEIVRGILDNHEGMAEDFPPRVYFTEFNDASLNLLMIYWYHPNDYWAFCKFGEEVNLKIMRAFEAEGIEFAFPTQTIYLAHDPNRQLQIDFSGEGPASEK